GYITLRINAHSFENGQPSSYYQNLKNGELRNYGFSASDYADPSEAYFRDMILRNVQAFRYLKTLEEWNGRDAVLRGGSMGGFQATAVAALEGGASELSVHIVWMCDVSGRSVGKLEGWLPQYTDNLRYFDTVYFAARVTCPTNITNAGLADYTATPCGVTAYYNALNCRKTLVFVQSADHSTAPIKKVTYSKSGN
ncbi:MAG: acetylxylan esterase, partial [Clostridia bacterium]|nr:acetylxylan esterase [Clostridia bacterium]